MGEDKKIRMYFQDGIRTVEIKPVEKFNFESKSESDFIFPKYSRQNSITVRMVKPPKTFTPKAYKRNRYYRYMRWVSKVKLFKSLGKRVKGAKK